MTPPLFPALIVLASLAAAQAPAPTTPARAQAAASETASFPIHVYLSFLEPGLGGVPAKAGDEAFAGPVTWTSPTDGRMAASFWRLGAMTAFKTSADRGTILELKTNLTLGQTDVWRLRHGYQLQGQKYVWNSNEDRRPELDAALGADYDRALLGAISLWARRRALEPRASAAPSVDDPSNWLDESVPLTYDSNGLVGEAPGELYIRLWGIPAHVWYTLRGRRPQPGDDNTMILEATFSVGYDHGDDDALAEWRRRHGYALGESGYAWDKDFPEPKPAMSEQFGRELDELMRKSALYWAEVAVSGVADSLDLQLKKKIGWKGVEKVRPDSPIERELRDLDESRRWPR